MTLLHSYVNFCTHFLLAFHYYFCGLLKFQTRQWTSLKSHFKGAHHQEITVHSHIMWNLVSVKYLHFRSHCRWCTSYFIDLRTDSLNINIYYSSVFCGYVLTYWTAQRRGFHSSSVWWWWNWQQQCFLVCEFFSFSFPVWCNFIIKSKMTKSHHLYYAFHVYSRFALILCCWVSHEISWWDVNRVRQKISSETSAAFMKTKRMRS